MGTFDDLRSEREAREAKARAVLEGQTQADVDAAERLRRADARAEREFAALARMVTQVLGELRTAVYPECEVCTDMLRLRWLLGIKPPARPGAEAPFNPIIIVAPLFDSEGATSRIQCESTFADAFRERRTRGRVERSADLSPEALAEALRKLHRR